MRHLGRHEQDGHSAAAPRPTVVVAGGTAGVGRAAARAFAELGHPVAVLARGFESLDATRAELVERRVPALAIHADVTDREAVEAAADRIEAELGPIGVWVNSAMVTVVGEFMDMAPEDFDRVVDVVFTGTANGTRAALARMGPRGAGRIVQVGSALAYRGIPLQSAYCAAKHAVQGLNDSLRAELIHRGSDITISEVNLPAVNTPQFDMCKVLIPVRPQPVPPIYQPEVAAEAIVHAARTGDRSLNVTFTATRTFAVNSVAPGALDRLLGEAGYDSQFAEDTAPARDRTDNLWEPLPGDHGCHGAFDDQARDSSAQERLRHSVLEPVARRTSDAGRLVLGRALKRLM